MSFAHTSAETPTSMLPNTPVAPHASSLELHRIREIRQQQNVSLRTCARRMSASMQTVREQEDGHTDLTLSDLYSWQKALEVPVADLLVDRDAPLSAPVLQRARMLKMMKTALSIRESSEEESVQRMAQTMVDQILEVMPELKDVSPWHTVGQRRTLDELGRTAEQTISERNLFDSL